MDRTWYVEKRNRQLLKWRQITSQIQQRVTTYVESMLKDNYIDENTEQNLIQTSGQPGRFYI